MLFPSEIFFESFFSFFHHLSFLQIDGGWLSDIKELVVTYVSNNIRFSFGKIKKSELG